MKTLQYLISLALIICAASCSRDDIKTYDPDNDAVRFACSSLNNGELGGIGYSTADKRLYVNFSFLENPFEDSNDCEIALTLIGKPDGTDRRVNYSIDTERTTAPDDSYEILESQIPAGKHQGRILVRVSNSPELSEETYELYLKLEDSEDLAAGPKEYISARLSWNNQIEEPINTHHIRSYNMMINSPIAFTSTSLNYYSPNALKAIVEATGWNDWGDYEVHGTSYNNPTTYFSYNYLPRYGIIYADNSYKGYAAKVKDYLAKYKVENGTPLLHDAGLAKGKAIEARSY